ncbi:uncharacterized protein CIMG_00455 [Coccidioides immitis RS]|uniref:Uncharacterized protein n=1 Tax=Coccidioides immitis (strain RS) TaxID=246410 RepID=J3KH12_COCIM|nr:uncharacterized protein CIMG_00455 [Coccidioides immitis RS]EAS35101.3 hypothetical protein CIMG_00455 [Coccidioides immitis RS]
MREHRQCIGFELRDRTRFSKSLPTLPPLKVRSSIICPSHITPSVVFQGTRGQQANGWIGCLGVLEMKAASACRAGWAGSGRTFEPAPDFQKRKRGHSARSNLSDPSNLMLAAEFQERFLFPRGSTKLKMPSPHGLPSP